MCMIRYIKAMAMRWNTNTMCMARYTYGVFMIKLVYKFNCMMMLSVLGPVGSLVSTIVFGL